jgi:hypothetical protein
MTLQQAISFWERAWKLSDPPEFQRTCQRAAESLRLQANSGEPHCVSHLRPRCVLCSVSVNVPA